MYWQTYTIYILIYSELIPNSPKSDVIEKSPKIVLTFIWHHDNIIVTNLTVVTIRTILKEGGNVMEQNQHTKTEY